MLSKNVVPIPTTDELWPPTDVTPWPTDVSCIKTGYPARRLDAFFVALKKNFNALWPLTVVVVIPVIIPVNPSTLFIDVIFSVWNEGNSMITSGGLECV